MPSFEQAVQDIIRAGNRLDTRGLAPATSGNYSVKMKDNEIAVTVSGRHKGRLGKEDIMRVDDSGAPLENKKPSAETLLHTQIYNRYPEAGAVLHVHSVAGVALTRLRGGDEIAFEGYEMLKAFPGIATHETKISVPVFANTQDMNVLAKTAEEKLTPGLHVYIIRDHGFYAWGRDMEEAERVAEALEHLLSCELEMIKLKGAAA